MLRKVLSASLLASLLLSAPARADTLFEAMAHAYANSPTLASAFAGVRAAGEGIRLEGAGRLPTVGGTANLSGSWTDAPQLPGASNWSSTGSVGLSYSQTLFDNHATEAAVDAARARYDAAVHGAANAEQNLLLNVATAHFNVIATQRIVAIRQENIGFMEAQLRSARDRLELGEGTRLDIAQAESAVARAQASYQAAINDLRRAEANYERWVGRPPRNPGGAGAISGLIPPSLDEAMEVALARHPGLLASQANIRAAQFQAEQTRARFGPQLALSAGTQMGGLTSGNLAPSANVGLSLTIPIFTPARDPSIQQANIGRIQSELEAMITRDTVAEAVRQAWAGIRSATAQIESATAAVAASRLALEVMVNQQEVGQATTLDVLDARADLLSVEEALVLAQAQRSIASYSLLAATGRLTAGGLGLPVQLRSPDGSLPVPVPVAPSAPADPWASLR